MITKRRLNIPIFNYKLVIVIADVYVAINEHYHNCSELFKSWFGEDIDQKVIEAAILFWFKDDDCKSNSKLWNHFKEN